MKEKYAFEIIDFQAHPHYPTMKIINHLNQKEGENQFDLEMGIHDTLSFSGKEVKIENNEAGSLKGKRICVKAQKSWLHKPVIFIGAYPSEEYDVNFLIGNKSKQDVISECGYGPDGFIEDNLPLEIQGNNLPKIFTELNGILTYSSYSLDNQKKFINRIWIQFGIENDIFNELEKLVLNNNLAKIQLEIKSDRIVTDKATIDTYVFVNEGQFVGDSQWQIPCKVSMYFDTTPLKLT